MRRVLGMIVVLIWAGDIVFTSNVSGQKLLSRKEARLIAEQTKEAEGLFGLHNGHFANCIEESVVKPCDSKWVQCIEDAWVVEFRLGETCKVGHDERLGLYIVVDAKDGRIISRYPESEYFTTPHYCHDSPDCLYVLTDQGNACLNFIHGQINGDKPLEPNFCECTNNECREKDKTN